MMLVEEEFHNISNDIQDNVLNALTVEKLLSCVLLEG